jgi:hypothetical protein
MKQKPKSADAVGVGISLGLRDRSLLRRLTAAFGWSRSKIISRLIEAHRIEFESATVTGIPPAILKLKGGPRDRRE